MAPLPPPGKTKVPHFKAGAGIKLHIGGHEQREGWITYGIAASDAVDVIGNCTDLHAFDKESCSEIYCSHVVEHLSMVGEVDQTLGEFYRVLTPGGRLRIAVPDISVLFRYFLDPRATMENRVTLLTYIYGGQTDEFDFHKCGFDAEILDASLSAAGFTNIERLESFGLFEDSSEKRIEDTPMSLNMSAQKN